MSILTSGVVQGMVGASSKLGHVDTSMSVYRQAKDRGDTATMDRAMNYASDSMKDATEYSKDAEEALKAAQEKAAEQERAETTKAAQTQTDVAKQAAAPQKAADKPVSGTSDSAVDRPEAAPEAGTVPNEVSVAAADVAAATQSSSAATDVQFYTSDGRAGKLPAEPIVSVTA